MDRKDMSNAMDAAILATPMPERDASGKSTPVQLQAYAFKAMEALLAGLPASPQSLTLSGHQLKAALALAWPDGEADPEQGETVVTLCQRSAFVATDEDGGNHDMPAGLYMVYDDMPDEGVVAVGETEVLAA